MIRRAGLFMALMSVARLSLAGWTDGEARIVKGAETGTFHAEATSDGVAMRYAGNGEDETFIAYFAAPLNLADFGEGISFEARSERAGVLCSVMVAGNSVVTRGYEATFLTGSNGWTRVEIPWEDFVANHKPWDTGATHQPHGAPNPKALTHIAFGRGNHMNTDYPRVWDARIRAFQPLAREVERAAPMNPVKAFAKTRGTLEAGKPLNILLLGDSITAGGGDRTYMHHVAEAWRAKYDSDITVVNAAVGGHSVRGGRLVLKRSLRIMPDPDLVFIMYGANDAKAVPIGLTAEIFQREMEALIDDLRRSTSSDPDLVVLTGMPRLNTERSRSARIVEPIVPGAKAAARSRNAVLVDTFSVYAALDAGEIARVYKDTIHPTPEEGQRFIAEIVHAGLPLDD